MIKHLTNIKNEVVNIVDLYAFAEHLRQWIVKHVLLLNDKKFKDTLRNEIINS